MANLAVRAFNRIKGSQAARNDFIEQAISKWLAQINHRSNWIRKTWQGAHDLVSARDVAILVGWDARGGIHDFAVTYARGLREAGFTVIYVTSSPKIIERDVPKMLAECALVVHRHNKGYDFGSYRDGIGLIPNVTALNRLVLCNDSVYGPFTNLKEAVFDRAPPEAADIWGLTDSWDTYYHVQSYFLLFHAAALQSKVFKDFWDKFLYVKSKSYIINNYEIGLTRKFLRAGLSAGGIFKYRDLVSAFMQVYRSLNATGRAHLSPEHNALIDTMYKLVQQASPLNPSHFFWDTLIVDHGFPFIKRELLSANPMRLPDMYRWDEIIRATGSYDIGQIENHLKLTLNKRAP